MSKKSKIFSYGTGKRKIGHSKFDMGFTNTYSQGFGALNPVAVYETLPDDFWNVGSDGVTLLKPLAAPAFSDIKNHLYAFNVRNSAIWEHWNDFITNGTAFSDVYGSNASNQAADNPWEVPSINARYFQEIGKIGSGFAFPVCTLSIQYDASLNTVFSPFLDGSKFIFHNISGYHDVTDAVILFLNTGYSVVNWKVSNHDEVRDIVNDSLVFALISQNSGVNVLTLCFAAVPAMGEYIKSLINGATLLTSDIPRPSTPRVGDADEQGSVADLNPHVTNEQTMSFAFMCDDSAARCKKSLSPFVVSQVSYFTNNSTYKTYRFVRRGGEADFQVFHPTNDDDTYHLLRSVDSNFTGRQLVYSPINGDWSNVVVSSPSVLSSGFDSSTDFYWDVPSSVFFVYGSPSASRVYSSMVDFLRSVPSWFGVARPIEEMFAVPYGQYAGNLFNVVQSGQYQLQLPTLENGLNPITEHEYNAAKSLGYDSAGFAIYLCRNSYQLLDSLGYPMAALSCRSFCYYRYQDFNALPLFANSKIWDKFFRNTVVSSPELDYCKTNGKILFDVGLRMYLADQTNFSIPDELPERYKGVNINDIDVNSWVIPFENIPLNGLLNEGLDVGVNGAKKLVVNLSGHHNQLVIRNRVDVFCLLTGYALDYMVLKKMYQIFTQTIAPGTMQTFYTFSELFTKNFYLPSYYNGLAHLKFQNFNKDYFTSAMLDPMSGANSVAVGSTITENRTNEAKQSWFERIAQQRSVKGFMEAIFGITPTLDNREPSFLGSTHVPINIGEVIQTSSSTPESPQGQRAGIGGARGGSSLVHGHINEHGWLIILSSFTVESQYHQGLQKQLNVLDSYMDYPTIDFAHIGNESILMKELNFDGVPVHPYTAWPLNFPSDKLFTVTFFDHKGEVLYGYGNPMRVTESSSSLVNIPAATSQPAYLQNSYLFRGLRNVAKSTGTSLDNVFGYIPRYSSYKFKLDECHGEFLDEFEFWHTFRHFYGMPILSHEFVNWELCVDDNEFNRIFAVNTNEDNKFLCQTRFNASVDRALPYVCVPQSK